MIGLIVTLAVAPGGSDDFEHGFGVLAAAVRATEPGNRVYELFCSKTRPNSYTLVEIYENEAALAAHQASPHLATGHRLTNPLLVGPPDVQTFDVVPHLD